MKGNNNTFEGKEDDKEGNVQVQAEIEEDIDYEEKGGFEEDVSDEEDFAITSISNQDKNNRQLGTKLMTIYSIDSLSNFKKQLSKMNLNS